MLVSRFARGSAALLAAAFAIACRDAQAPSAPPSPSAMSSTASGSRTQPPSPASTARLTRCEDLPDQTFVSDNFHFAISCPKGFWWETFANLPPGFLFGARTVDESYLGRYPAGQIELHVRLFDSDTLRHWIDTHTGPASSGDTS